MSLTKKSNSTGEQKAWFEFGHVVHAGAVSLSLFGWDDAAAQQYVKTIRGRCDPIHAITAFRDLLADTGEFPTASDVIDRAGRNSVSPSHGGKVFLKSPDGFCYQGSSVLGMPAIEEEKINGRKTGKILKFTIDCGCEKCNSARAFGADPSGPPGELVHWSQCSEGREFATLWNKLSGKTLEDSLKTLKA